MDGIWAELPLHPTGGTLKQTDGALKLCSRRRWERHSITGDQPCNPATKQIARMGPCHSGDESLGQTVTATGLPNPNYRPTINAVGRRFFVDSSNTFDIFASGVVMF